MSQYENGKQSDVDQFVIFRLDQESYGVSIHYVEIIEKVTAITRVPNSNDFVLGVINLRGEIVPVIDLRKRFNLSPSTITEESRIIILSVEDMTVGILTDSSSEVLNIPKNQIENTGTVLSIVDETSVEGIGKVDDRMIILLDIHSILELDKAEN
ncbi:chemotaxis protein CheW [Tindallia californiensis]|uniref:Purine-binding chemotaxis protein CheW n=1 Tax=Tindallia californiensis TaxID=159292 RepID=A0A1H3NQG0_9FIRM|nr:chemotaxis protein CheW [Tindallia californiensis]SDY91141.1 purine-binding chemotaxis protein CheW [Tindallia californiensis]